MRALVLIGAGLVICLAACDRVPGTDAYMIARAKQNAAAILVDDSSAQFRKLTLREIPKAKQAQNDVTTTHVLCGEMRGRNSNGPYEGFSRFIADPEHPKRVARDPQVSVREVDAENAIRRCEIRAKSTLAQGAVRKSILTDCRKAFALHHERARQTEFERVYASLCQAKST